MAVLVRTHGHLSLQVNIEDEIAALEAEAAIHCKAYDAECDKRDGFLKQNKAFKVGIAPFGSVHVFLEGGVIEYSNNLLVYNPQTVKNLR